MPTLQWITSNLPTSNYQQIGEHDKRNYGVNKGKRIHKKVRKKATHS